MVQQTMKAPYAKEMERLSAKESLLLALKDGGGFKALVTGNTTSLQQIDVNDRIVSLQRLTPTRNQHKEVPSSNGEFIKIGSGDQGWIFEYFCKCEIIKFGDVFGILWIRIESRFTVSTRLSVEGPLRMKEEYVEGIFESPKINEELTPEQQKGTFGQAASMMQQLPVPIKDAVAGGLKVSLG